MESETVQAICYRDFAEYRVDFLFVNSGAPQTLQLGFPYEVNPEGDSRGGLIAFHAWQDGTPLAVTMGKGPDTWHEYYLHQATFPTGKTMISVSYLASPTVTSGTRFQALMPSGVRRCSGHRGRRLTSTTTGCTPEPAGPEPSGRRWCASLWPTISADTGWTSSPTTRTRVAAGVTSPSPRPTPRSAATPTNGCSRTWSPPRPTTSSSVSARSSSTRMARRRCRPSWERWSRRSPPPIRPSRPQTTST